MINEEKRKIQMEALAALRENKFKGIVILPTGTGKTYVLIEALRELYKQGMSVLYTCDSTLLRDEGFDEELKKWDAGEFCDIIEKKCYQTTYKWENKHYNILLADEGDYGLTPEYSKLFLNNTFDYIIFVSATLEKKKRIIANQIAPVVYQKKIKEIEDKKVINKSQFFYVPYALNAKENAMYVDINERFRKLLDSTPPPHLDIESKGKWYINREKRLRFLTFERLHFLAALESSVYICRKLMTELYQADEKSRMLIFCGATEQADKVCKYSFHTKNAKDDNLGKFNRGEIQAVAVCGKVDRGLNLTGVNKAIMEYITGSETKAIQKLGRGKRLSVEDILEAYILIPYYRKPGKDKLYPTIVLDKAKRACRNLGIENAKTYIVKT